MSSIILGLPLTFFFLYGIYSHYSDQSFMPQKMPDLVVLEKHDKAMFVDFYLVLLAS